MKRFLIVFQATQEFTEGLALALGLGAVQRGGLIRLRHLGDRGETQLAHQGYGRLKADDLGWAECVAVGIEAEEPVAELDEILALVQAFSDRAALLQKLAFVFGTPGSALVYVRQSLQGAGMRLSEDSAEELSPERMMQAGNRLAETVSFSALR